MTCALLSSPSLGQKCDFKVSWKDAHYLKRSTVNGNVSSSAEWRRYFDAVWIQLDFDGQITTLIQYENGIQLVNSKNGAVPKEFAEIAMAVESPMWAAGRANFLRFQKPCQLKESENTPVSQRDLVLDLVDASAMPKFFGNLRRQGMRISYAIEIQRGKSDDQFDHLYGTWEYIPKLTKFPFDYDVQGWTLFHGDTRQRQLPIGRRIRISEVLVGQY